MKDPVEVRLPTSDQFLIILGVKSRDIAFLPLRFMTLL